MTIIVIAHTHEAFDILQALGYRLSLVIYICFRNRGGARSSSVHNAGAQRDSENTTLTCHSDHIHIVNLLLLLYSEP